MRRAHFWVVVGFISAAAFSRLIPHPPNLTPIGAMALFGGAAFGWTWAAFALPLGAMLLSDVVLGALAGDLSVTFHPHMPVVYLAFVINVILGQLLLRRPGVVRLGAVVSVGAIQFFVLTNFAVWAIGSWYPKTWEGLVACYVAALPFFQNQLLGDLAFSAVLFGAWALVQQTIPALRPAQVSTRAGE